MNEDDLLNGVAKGGKQLRFMIAKIVEAYVFLEICEKIKLAGIPDKKTKEAYQRVVNYCYKHQSEAINSRRTA